MRKKFREFYNSDTIDFENLKEDVLIVFDTNTLLNIYRYSSATSNTFINSIKKVKNNIWIPYQVGMEFNLKRKKIMSDVKKAPDIFIKDFENRINDFINGIKNDLGSYFLKSTDAKQIKEGILSELTTEINEMKNNIIDKKFKNLANLVDTDEDRLTELIEVLDDKVGNSFSQEEIDKICKEGKVRYENDLPPGYRDKKKTEVTCFNGLEFESKYGDLIIWKQIIDRAKEDSINTVVLITDDNKPDWWYPVDGKNIGPRAELKNELVREANADLIMINSNSFLKQSNSAEIMEDLVDIKSINLEEIDNTIRSIELIGEKLEKELKNRRIEYFEADKETIGKKGAYYDSELIIQIQVIEEKLNYYCEKVFHELENTSENIIDELLYIYSKLNDFRHEISMMIDNLYLLTSEKLERIRLESEYLIKRYIYLVQDK